MAEICLSFCVNWMMNRWVQHPLRRQGDLDMVEFHFRLIVECVEMHIMQIWWYQQPEKAKLEQF